MSYGIWQEAALRIYKGDKATVDAYVGIDGELAIDTETLTLRILDGVTPGGIPIKAQSVEPVTTGKSIAMSIVFGG